MSRASREDRLSTNEKAVSKDGLCLLFDNLDDPACSRFDQYCSTVYHRIAMLADAILGRYIVVGNALFWKNRSDSYIFAVLVGGAALFSDVGMKARTLIDTEHSRDAANDSTDHSTHDCTDWACCTLAVPRTALDASRDALGLGRDGKKNRDGNSGGSDKTADHESSYGGDW
jgi:hypothetical protein